MDEKKFSRIVRHPRHISGIYNYCDRWCERCPFTLRCSIYAMEMEMKRGAKPHDRKTEELWPRLESAIKLAAGMIEANVEHAGVGLVKDPILKGKLGRPTDEHRIGIWAKRYMEFAHAFLKSQEDRFAAELLGGTGHEAISAQEAIDVIAWFHMQIMIKLSRALPDEDDDDVQDDPELADMPRDEDGSAKVALIGMDWSIVAWAVLSRHEPAFLETALSAMLTLHRLRAAVEKEFPKARGFVRPGFDTHAFPKRRG